MSYICASSAVGSPPLVVGSRADKAEKGKKNDEEIAHIDAAVQMKIDGYKKRIKKEDELTTNLSIEITALKEQVAQVELIRTMRNAGSLPTYNTTR